jgi:hypothetical protein
MGSHSFGFSPRPFPSRRPIHSGSASSRDKHRHQLRDGKQMEDGRAVQGVPVLVIEVVFMVVVVFVSFVVFITEISTFN